MQNIKLIDRLIDKYLFLKHFYDSRILDLIFRNSESFWKFKH